MFNRFQRITIGHRAFSTMASDNGRVLVTAALTGAVAGGASAFAVSSLRPGGPSEAPAPAPTPKYQGKTQDTRSASGGIGAKWTKPVVIASPSLEPLATTLRKRLGSENFTVQEGATLDVSSFKSGDYNIKFNWERVIGRHVVMLFDTVDQSRFFEQLAVLQALQGFAVPHGGDKETKWKTYVDQGKYSWGRASGITVVMPWYRPCQMERTSRWQFKEDGSWTNADPNGKWLDVPNAQYYARLLCTPGSVPPFPGPAEALDDMPLNPLWRPPVELLFMELHEEAPVSHSVSDLGATIRTERFVPYFLDKFKGKRAYPGKANMYILFPDRGAFDRYAESVVNVLSLNPDHIVFMEKSRVGDQISQSQQLFYEQGKGLPRGEKKEFKAGDHVMIIDDFTNSGSTLFGAVNLVKKMTVGDVVPDVSIFVSHIVATYDPKQVSSIKEKLHSMGPNCKLFCTNSIPLTTDLLKGDSQIEVVDISDFIADMVQKDTRTSVHKRLHEQQQE